jgi:hypothetical protein
MKIIRAVVQRVTDGILFIISLCLLFIPITSFANPEYLAAEPKLNLTLPDNYTAPPPEGIQHDLNVTANIHQGALSNLKQKKIRLLGVQQLKVDKSLRVRGWEVKDDFYVGQTRVGKKWGLGMMMTDGNFAYGLNNKGVGMIYSGENSIYRVNMQEVSMEIDF